MYLPQNALYCISRLENAGYPCYAVGGCVRDALLGLPPHDYDLCTAATPAQIKQVFADLPQIHAGEKHGTIGIIFLHSEVYEITTFRTEGTYGDSRHPDWVEFVTDIRQDLARRDFTVNAMAYSPSRGFADPFGGRDDLKTKTLRAVGDPMKRFSEDALRILRGVRFSVTYGLQPEAETEKAMLCLAPTMEHLARERVFDELCKLILHINANQMVAFAPILIQVIPELAPAMGFDQRNPHHIYDIYTHTAHVVEAAPKDLALRWAALLHDVGKMETFTIDGSGIGHFYGHADRSAEIADTILRRLKAPNTLREKAVPLIQWHMTKIEPTKKCVRRWLSRLGYETFANLLTLQEADMGSKGSGDSGELSQFDVIRCIAAEIQEENTCLSIKDLALNGHDLMALGYKGPEIGKTLHQLLDAVLDEQVENKKDALLHHITYLEKEEYHG